MSSAKTTCKARPLQTVRQGNAFRFCERAHARNRKTQRPSKLVKRGCIVRKVVRDDIQKQAAIANRRGSFFRPERLTLISPELVLGSRRPSRVIGAEQHSPRVTEGKKTVQGQEGEEARRF